MFYVFNLSFRDKDSEDQYFFSIISDIIPDKKLKEVTITAISKCHEFLRSFFDSAEILLRELIRFKKLYLFFIKYYQNKRKLYPKKSGTDESIKLKSIIISIYICYYIRLNDAKKDAILKLD